MNRQTLRDRYPFHNPRQHVTCCLPRTVTRRTFNALPLVRALVILSSVAVLARVVMGA